MRRPSHPHEIPPRHPQETFPRAIFQRSHSTPPFSRNTQEKERENPPPLQNTPVLLRVKRRRIITLPQGIERVEKKQIRGKLRADRRYRRLLRLGRCNRLVVVVPLVGPSRLGDHHMFTATRLLDARDLALDEFTGIRSLGVGIEPGVNVDHDDVRGGAYTWVVDDGGGGLDGSDWTVVACLTECFARLFNGALGIAGRHCFGVDPLIFDTNETEDVPVAAVVLFDSACHGANNFVDALYNKVSHNQDFTCFIMLHEDY